MKKEIQSNDNQKFVSHEDLEALLKLPQGRRFRIFSLTPMPTIIINGELRS